MIPREEPEQIDPPYSASICQCLPQAVGSNVSGESLAVYDSEMN
jgi:hypothetical protein